MSIKNIIIGVLVGFPVVVALQVAGWFVPVILPIAFGTGLVGTGGVICYSVAKA